MFKPYAALCTVLALSCASCSFIFVHPPHQADEQLTSSPHKCTTSKAAPIVDTLIGGFQVVRTGLALGKTDADYRGAPISRGADIGFGVGFATLFLASSIYGFYETGQCHASNRGPVVEETRPPPDEPPPPPPPNRGDRHAPVAAPPPQTPQTPSRRPSPEEP